MQGLYAKLTYYADIRGECLVIGYDVPRVHHPNGLPIYLVREHPNGRPLTLPGVSRPVRLLAYPGDWPAPGKETTGRMVFCNIESLSWRGKMVPVFDTPT